MKKTLVLLVVVFTTIISQAQSIDDEKEAIKKVIQTAYVEGLQNEGDFDKIDSGIHSGFNLLGISENNEMWTLSIADWKKKTEKQKKEGKFPRVGEDKVSIKFLFVDVTGNAAVAKIEFYVGTEKMYVDYISLYKFETGWKMVNKIYYKF